jgi:hypothetical protein
MMDWIKKHYDLAILAAVTLVLVANAALIFATAQSEDATLAIPPATAEDALPDFQSTTLESADSAAENPTVWQLTDSDPNRASLLVSRTYLLKDGKLFDPIEGGENLHDPIPNAWLIEHGLDYTAKDIKERDSDGDGFTNLEEFLEGTNPKDSASKPAGYSKLKLVDFKSIPFRIVFKGDPSGTGAEFQLNFLELKGAARTQYKKLNDPIEGAPYKIASYKENKFTDDRGIPVDRSELTLENTENGNSIVLVKDKQTDDPGSEGTFFNQITKETFDQKKGGTFVLQPDQIEFKIIDITPDSAQIQDTTTGQTYRISKAENSNPQ